LEIDTGKVGAAIERLVPDAGDTCADHDVCQVGAVIERIRPNACNTGGDSIRNSGLACRVLNERGQIFVEQNPVQAAINWIIYIHRYRGQAGALSECNMADAGNILWNCHAGQPRSNERRFPNVGNAVGNRNASQFGAEKKRIVAYAGDAIGYCDVWEAGAVPELKVRDTRDVGAYRDVSQASALSERIIPDIGDAVGDRDAFQADAIVKGFITNAGDIGAYRDVGHAFATRECLIPNADYR